jgi:PKD repeat protein
VSWNWSFGDNSTSNDRNPSHTYQSGGTFTVTLTVTDNGGLTDTETRTVSVTAPPPPNQAPSAAFNSSCTDLACSFNSDASSDDGTIVSWSWNFGDNTSSNDRNPSHTYTNAGTYDVTLTVTDDDGVSDPVTHQVTVSAPPPPNEAPTAAFSAPTSCTAGEPCQFTDESNDPDGRVMAWNWDFDDGGAKSNEQSPSHTYSASGSYNVKLRVTDDDNAQSSEVQHAVTVSDPPPPLNSAPLAQIGSISCTGMHCEYTDDSTDPDGAQTIASYAWVFGDGASSDARNPSHDYASAAEYTVTLTVTDDQGASDQAAQNVSVQALPGSTGGTGNLVAKGPHS